MKLPQFSVETHWFPKKLQIWDVSVPNFGMSVGSNVDTSRECNCSQQTLIKVKVLYFLLIIMTSVTSIGGSYTFMYEELLEGKVVAPV
jgi:hypothetical protein